MHAGAGVQAVFPGQRYGDRPFEQGTLSLLRNVNSWSYDISKTLPDNYFVANDKDSCVFDKDVDGLQLTICLYAVAQSTACKSVNEIDRLSEMLSVMHNNIKLSVSDKLEFVGLDMHFSVPGECRETMQNLIDITISGPNVSTAAPTLAVMELYVTRKRDENLDAAKAEVLRSPVMKLQHLAERGGPDILLPVVCLLSRVSKSISRDWRKLEKVVRDLRGSQYLSIHLKPVDGLLPAMLMWSYPFRYTLMDVLTNPLQGGVFRAMRDKILEL